MTATNTSQQEEGFSLDAKIVLAVPLFLIMSLVWAPVADSRWLLGRRDRITRERVPDAWWVRAGSAFSAAVWLVVPMFVAGTINVWAAIPVGLFALWIRARRVAAWKTGITPLARMGGIRAVLRHGWESINQGLTVLTWATGGAVAVGFVFTLLSLVTGWLPWGWTDTLSRGLAYVAYFGLVVAYVALVILITAWTRSYVDDRLRQAAFEAELRERLAVVLSVQPDTIGAVTETTAYSEDGESRDLFHVVVPPKAFVKSAADIDAAMADVLPEMAFEDRDPTDGLLVLRWSTEADEAARALAAGSDGLIVGVTGGRSATPPSDDDVLVLDFDDVEGVAR